MSNKHLITYNYRVASIEQVVYSPVAVLPPPISQPIGTVFCFLAKVDPWSDENEPPVPTQDQKYIKNVFKNMFVMKQILSNQIAPVTERIEWISGESYDYYRDDVDMFEVDSNKSLIRKFYVKNRYDQVFKCLWNNNDGPSTFEPFFQPGTYGTNNIFKGDDGYKWKYMYTVDVGSKLKFMDANWIPVLIGYTPNSIETPSGAGSIDAINVINGGSGYDPTLAPIEVIITGDGTGATAEVETNNGVITDVIVTNPGKDYSYVNVSIVSGLGNGATVYAAASPVGGHGSDPISELGCSNVMFTCEFNGSEGGLIPTDIDYRQLGILISPTALSTYDPITNTSISATGLIYKLSTDFIVAQGFGSYVNDETIYQGTDINNATFTATVLSFDPETNIIHLINKTGTYTYNSPVFGNTSKTVRTLLTVSEPDFRPYSGYISYIENRTGVQRSADGVEQVKLILSY
jgi:hypothetical protein